MSLQDSNVHAQFGIDEIYFHTGFTCNLLEKLQQRAILSLDIDDTIVQKHVSQDMVMIFHKRIPSQNLIYRFLQFLHQHVDKTNFIKSNTLLNEDELFSAIRLKKFVLVTHKILPKTIHSPKT